jgi:hypothetical protein
MGAPALVIGVILLIILAMMYNGLIAKRNQIENVFATIDKQVYLSFAASKLHVAIAYKKNLFEPKLFQSVLNMQTMQEYLEDLLLVVSIVEELNLNTRIWSKQSQS